MINAKEVTKLVAKMATIEDQQLIMSLHEENLQLRENILELKEENRQLKDQASLHEEMRFRANFYWRVDQDGQEEGPFCPGCKDGKGKAVRMHDLGNGYYNCTICTYRAAGPNYREPEIRSTAPRYY